MTKKELEKEVDYYNKKYCSRGSVQLDILSAYGGHQVVIRSKRDKKNKPINKTLDTGTRDITYGFDKASAVANDLMRCDSKGWLKDVIKSMEKRRRG